MHWKEFERSGHALRYYSLILVEGLKETIKTLSGQLVSRIGFGTFQV
jgi:hypothetical protein